MKYIAHRGFKNGTKENTIASFKNAINDDYFSGFELDIRESKDKKIVVIHDAFIDRVTNEIGLVKNKSSKELKKLGIPLLEDVLKLKTDKIIMIEIKDYDMNLDNLVKLLNKYKNKNIYVVSFSKKVIKKLMKYKRNFKLGVFNIVINSDKSYDNYDFIGIYKNILTNELARYFIKRNIQIFVWGLMDHIYIDKSFKYKNKLFLIVNTKI